MDKKKKGKYKLWRNKEVMFLQQHYLEETQEWMAEKLGRPLGSVAQMVFRLKLNKKCALKQKSLNKYPNKQEN